MKDIIVTIKYQNILRILRFNEIYIKTDFKRSKVDYK